MGTYCNSCEKRKCSDCVPCSYCAGIDLICRRLKEYDEPTDDCCQYWYCGACKDKAPKNCPGCNDDMVDY
jgi:hypothetical protein